MILFHFAQLALRNRSTLSCVACKPGVSVAPCAYGSCISHSGICYNIFVHVLNSEFLMHTLQIDDCKPIQIVAPF